MSLQWDPARREFVETDPTDPLAPNYDVLAGTIAGGRAGDEMRAGASPEELQYASLRSALTRVETPPNQLANKPAAYNPFTNPGGALLEVGRGLANAGAGLATDLVDVALLGVDAARAGLGDMDWRDVGRDSDNPLTVMRREAFAPETEAGAAFGRLLRYASFFIPSTAVVRSTGAAGKALGLARGFKGLAGASTIRGISRADFIGDGLRGLLRAGQKDPLVKFAGGLLTGGGTRRALRAERLQLGRLYQNLKAQGAAEKLLRPLGKALKSDDLLMMAGTKELYRMGGPSSNALVALGQRAMANIRALASPAGKGGLSAMGRGAVLRDTVVRDAVASFMIAGDDGWEDAPLFAEYGFFGLIPDETRDFFLPADDEAALASTLKLTLGNTVEGFFLGGIVDAFRLQWVSRGLQRVTDPADARVLAGHLGDSAAYEDLVRSTLRRSAKVRRDPVLTKEWAERSKAAREGWRRSYRERRLAHGGFSSPIQAPPPKTDRGRYMQWLEQNARPEAQGFQPGQSPTGGLLGDREIPAGTPRAPKPEGWGRELSSGELATRMRGVDAVSLGDPVNQSPTGGLLGQREIPAGTPRAPEPEGWGERLSSEEFAERMLLPRFDDLRSSFESDVLALVELPGGPRTAEEMAQAVEGLFQNVVDALPPTRLGLSDWLGQTVNAPRVNEAGVMDPLSGFVWSKKLRRDVAEGTTRIDPDDFSVIDDVVKQGKLDEEEAAVALVRAEEQAEELARRASPPAAEQTVDVQAQAVTPEVMPPEQVVGEAPKAEDVALGQAEVERAGAAQNVLDVAEEGQIRPWKQRRRRTAAEAGGAPVPAAEAAEAGGRRGELLAMVEQPKTTKAQLLEIADEMGIKVSKRSNKASIAEMIRREAQRPQPLEESARQMMQASAKMAQTAANAPEGSITRRLGEMGAQVAGTDAVRTSNLAVELEELKAGGRFNQLPDPIADLPAANAPKIGVTLEYLTPQVRKQLRGRLADASKDVEGIDPTVIKTSGAGAGDNAAEIPLDHAQAIKGHYESLGYDPRMGPGQELADGTVMDDLDMEAYEIVQYALENQQDAIQQQNVIATVAQDVADDVGGVCKT